MPINSRSKGARGELELVHILRDYYGYNVRRGHSYIGEPDIVNLKGIHIECKLRERLNIWEAMKQSKKDAEKMKDGEPVVIHRKAREEWLVTMPLSLFMDMYTSYNSDVEVHGETK